MKNKYKKLVKKIFSSIILVIILSFLTSNIVSAAHCQQGYVHGPDGNCITYTWDSGPSTTTITTDPNSYSTTHTDPSPNIVPPPNTTTITPTGGGDDYKKGYRLLAPLDDFEYFDTKRDCAFTAYLNIIIRIFIGICAVLAMLMIVIGGIEYMSSELISSKEHGKSQITQAILGLLLALTAWIILYEINPRLLDFCLNNLPDAKPVVIEGDIQGAPFTPISKSALEAFGVHCPGGGGVDELSKIARSFNGKVTYNQIKRGTTDSTTIYLDCSSFVKQVYECAGLGLPGSTTYDMLPGGELINTLTLTKANDKKLEIGDVLGWMKGESARFPRAGHVVMYLGNGTFIEVSSGSGLNGAVNIRPLSSYIDDLRRIIRAPLSSGGGGSSW